MALGGVIELHPEHLPNGENLLQIGDADSKSPTRAQSEKFTFPAYSHGHQG